MDGTIRYKGMAHDRCHRIGGHVVCEGFNVSTQEPSTRASGAAIPWSSLGNDEVGLYFNSYTSSFILYDYPVI